MNTFTSEALLASLIAKYAHLNDNNATANKVYELIMASQPKTK